MGKYEPLGNFLKKQASSSEVRMTFAEIEKVIGTTLPPSAYDHRPWWSNNPSNNVMTKVWLAAGFETEQVDMDGRTLVFRNHAKIMHTFEEMEGMNELSKTFANGMADEARVFHHPAEGKPISRHPLIGAMKGTFTIEPGWDLTRPSLDPEELEEMEANLDRMADMIESGLTGNKR
jgi:hypothetical protein